MTSEQIIDGWMKESAGSQCRELEDAAKAIEHLLKALDASQAMLESWSMYFT